MGNRIPGHKAKKAVNIAFPSEAFHGEMPPIGLSLIRDRKVYATILGAEWETSRYIIQEAIEFVNRVKTGNSTTHLLFDFHVLDPAVIGVTFAYDYRSDTLHHWEWTEQPDKVDALTIEEVKKRAKVVTDNFK